MPLNPTTYLEGHGWQGQGVPLDGKEGRGLKKPLALPNKRNLRGLGKDRDRATEWWDCLFEASAKSINIQVGADKGNVDAGKTAAPSEGVGEKTSKSVKTQGRTKDQKDGNEDGVASQGKLSLVSQAKREYARKMLMNGFVRGHETRDVAAEDELERALKAQGAEKKASRAAASASDDQDQVAGDERARAKEEKRQRKEEKKKRKADESQAKEASGKKRKREKDEGDGKVKKDKRDKASKRVKKAGTGKKGKKDRIGGKADTDKGGEADKKRTLDKSKRKARPE